MSKESEKLFRQHDTCIDTDRRDLLQTLAAAGLVTSVGAGTAAAGPGDGGDAQGNGGTDEKPQRGRDLFVDPDHGDDDWQGNQPEPVGKGKNGNGPLETVQAAIDRAREWANQDDRDTVNVWFREGRYDLDEAAVVEPFDRETAINLFAYPDEHPVLDGGRRITGWEETEVNGVDAWVADVPDVASGDWYFRQLFVNGERRQRARMPKGDDPRRDVFNFEIPSEEPGGFNADVRRWNISGLETELDPSEAEWVYNHIWVCERSPIESVEQLDQSPSVSGVDEGSFVPTDFQYTTEQNSESSYVGEISLDGKLRNDYEGYLGEAVTLSPNADPVTVTQLGRIVAPENDQVHEVILAKITENKDFNKVGVDVLASTDVDTASASQGEFVYSDLDEPVTLEADEAYIIASQEFEGGDQWYNSGNTRVEGNPDDGLYPTGPSRDSKDAENEFNAASYPLEFESSGQEATYQITTTLASAYRNRFRENFSGIYFENVQSALREPGEWYLSNEGELYYIPKDGESINSVEIVAPETTRLLDIQGKVPDTQNGGDDTFRSLPGEGGEVDFVENLVINGLTFQYSRWVHTGLKQEYIEEYGKGYDRPVNDIEGVAASGNGAWNTPDVIRLLGTRQSSITNCTVQKTGAYAINVDAGCRNVEIGYNRLNDIGAGGIDISGGREPARKADIPRFDEPGLVQIDEPDPETTFTGNISVTDNYMVELGQVWFEGMGILHRHAFDCNLSHNHIEHLRNIGINVGTVNSDVETETQNNLVEKNKLHAFGDWIDTGPIHTLGRQPGTTIRGNYMFDYSPSEAAGHKGLYLDGGTSETISVDNVIDSRGANFAVNLHSSGGLLTGGSNIVTNNILIGGANGSLSQTTHEKLELSNNVILSETSYWARDVLLDEELNRSINRNNLWTFDGELVNTDNEVYVPTNLKFSRSGSNELPYIKEISSTGILRDGFDGYLGHAVTLGQEADPITVEQLGRIVAPGNTQVHKVLLAKITGDETGNKVRVERIATVYVDPSNGTEGEFAYAELESSVTLDPGEAYIIASQEFEGGDQWYDFSGTKIETQEGLFPTGRALEKSEDRFNVPAYPLDSDSAFPVGDGVSFDEWTDAGFDTESIVADPQFKGFFDEDFQLEEDSPAFDIGFEAIDLSDVGVRGGDDNAGA